MGHATASFSASGQSTTDNGSNPTTFTPGPVDLKLSSDGFIGTVQLRSRMRNSVGAYTPWEVVEIWTEADMPVHDEFTFVPGFEWQLYCLTRSAGTCHVRMGN